MNTKSIICKQCKYERFENEIMSCENCASMICEHCLNICDNCEVPLCQDCSVLQEENSEYDYLCNDCDSDILEKNNGAQMNDDIITE